MESKWHVQIIKLSDADCQAMRKVSATIQDEIAKKDALCAKVMTKLKETVGAK